MDPTSASIAYRARMDSKPRIALLIDADNSSAKKIDLILNELSGFGETSIRRAYGNWTKPGLKQWADVLHAQAIRPVQQYDYSRGKNASDMAMVVDAMSLLYNDHPEAFGIVSSDADFTPLVMHLREKGAAVYGFGDTKTPAPFRSACTRFVFLDQLAEPEDEQPDDASPPAAPTRAPERATARTTESKAAEPKATKAKPDSEKPKTPSSRKSTGELRQDAGLVRLLRNAAQRAATEDNWAPVSTMGQYISNQSSFDSRNYGYASLTKLLAATELFDMRDEGTSNLAVRDKRHAKG